MTNKDRVIIAFLVSAGLFSLVQAKDYVRTLTSKEKSALAPVTKMQLQKALVSTDPYQTQEPKSSKVA